MEQEINADGARGLAPTKLGNSELGRILFSLSEIGIN